MTISYSLDVAKARFCGFSRLLARWKGGIYKILWREFLIFCFLYAILSITYRCYLSEEQKGNFEKVVIFVETYTDAIPLSFVLGFYVSLVIGRWWGQYETIPWPDRLAFMIASYVHGSDERSRMIRRTLGRYVILAQVLTFQAVSTSVKRRFPTTQHLVEAGIMTKEEKTVYDKISFMHGKWWLPCHWFTALATRAKKEGRIKDTILLNGLFQEILNYRTSCAIMFGYDWISVPLVYTQVVTIATYMYSLALLVGRQYLDPAKGYRTHDIDLYIPFFTLLQFFFYMGWLKVAEQILNPYGEDDDDFELNWCLDRTVHIVYLLVDNLQLKHPRVGKDLFWDQTDIILPQTKKSASFNVQPQLGSANSMGIEEAEYLPLDAFHEQDREENIYRGGSFKARGDELRPSLIRRLLSSRSRLASRSPLSKENSSNSGSQGFTNPVFEMNDEMNNPSFRYTTPINATSSLNNAIKPGPPNLKGLNVSFRPNSLSLNRRKTYHLRDAEKAFYSSPNSPVDKTPDPNPVSRTISAPQFKNNEGMTLNQVAEDDDCLECDNLDQKIDSLMPPIPEEASRNPSLASIETGPFKNPLKRLEDVQNLVQEANKVLLELKKSVSSADGVEYEAKGYESCCSKDDPASYSDEDEVEIENVDNRNFNETSITIDIDQEKDKLVEATALHPGMDSQNNIGFQGKEYSVSCTFEDKSSYAHYGTSHFNNAKFSDTPGDNKDTFTPNLQILKVEDSASSENLYLATSDEQALISKNDRKKPH
ncbi:hypothetical protein JTE90_027624 [Oedothorax gibbosus]|uniref:Bestrophin homolog n=1 Tax=Oedothorax gibbosus TaxID=931172 RepID=A0AAV6VMJ8_9ARAC|nr:hypothetical protein JTE90_027624 [Oedothorax gibbosus]